MTLKPWEFAQLASGLAIPMLLATHVAGTRIVDEIAGVRSDYTLALAVFWQLAPLTGWVHVAGLMATWIHGCIGLHIWLRLQSWYTRRQPLAISLAVLIPALSLAGYVSAGVQVRNLVQADGWATGVLESFGRDPAMNALVDDVQFNARVGVVATVLVILGLRLVRAYCQRRGQVPVIRYVSGDRTVPLVPGGTALEAFRVAGIRHASVCGGRGRCSTCRIQIGAGRDDLPPPDEGEAQVLKRLGLAGGDVRLACQIRPRAGLTVTAMLPPETSGKNTRIGQEYQRGDEVNVAILFVDLRGSTRLSEDRLPFDVVFILNQFFTELSTALEETNGHYAQFNGDGLMALYGLSTSPGQACRDALTGADAMLRRIEALSDRLSDELGAPLRIGVGIHFGEAIVGLMGPPETPIVSALGDNVNIAARLESMTRELGVRLCVSARTLETAGLNIAGMDIHELPVKGRERPVRVVGLDKAPAAM